MSYLIDSDWVIDHLANVEEATQLLSRLSQVGIAITAITYMEAYQGVLRSPIREGAEELLAAFVEEIPIIRFTPATARVCASIREALKKQGKRVNSRALDLLNAATALEHDLTLVTRNLDDYEDIPGLKLYRSN